MSFFCRIRFLDKQKKIREQQKQQSKKAEKARVDSQPSDEEDFIPGKYFNDS